MKGLATNARDKPSQIFAQVVSQCDDSTLPGSLFGIHVPLVAQLGINSVVWYNLHFGLMIVKVNFFLLYKKGKKPYILL
jgi:hypothetical protein